MHDVGVAARGFSAVRIAAPPPQAAVAGFGGSAQLVTPAAAPAQLYTQYP